MPSASFLVFLCLSTGLLASTPVGTVLPVEPPVPVDCTSIIDFLDDEVMALSHTASFGETCVTIETLVHFGTDGMPSWTLRAIARDVRVYRDGGGWPWPGFDVIGL